MKYLIISGGHTDYDFACDVIKNGSFEVIIAVDSGMDFLYKNKMLPDVIVGDFDSVTTEALEYFREQPQIEICVLTPEKDDTDTEHAIRYAIEKGANDITIIGGTGTRLDHVFGNVCSLGIGLEESVDIQIIDPYNRIRLFNHSFQIIKDNQFGQFVSLVPFMGNVKGLTIRGMKYELDNYELGGFNSLGISNEIIADVAEVAFESGNLLVIESRDN